MSGPVKMEQLKTSINLSKEFLESGGSCNQEDGEVRSFGSLKTKIYYIFAIPIFPMRNQ